VDQKAQHAEKKGINEMSLGEKVCVQSTQMFVSICSKESYRYTQST